MPRMCKLEDQLSLITANRKVLERVLPHKFFEVKWIQENLKWTDYLTKTVSSCFAAQEGKKNETQSMWKRLIDKLVLSKFDQRRWLYPLPQYLRAKLYNEFKDAPHVFWSWKGERENWGRILYVRWTDCFWGYSVIHILYTYMYFHFYSHYTPVSQWWISPCEMILNSQGFPLW